ncbi:hypothetical protein A3K69_08775 [Candidatus Bathyarchaeota archaeon RBG_16_57_9]|nr:MAG: hypothetical protein A3K69_08775 [Candidatus Bathyarchaeota archaeon RBG_16_57_9]
MSAESTAKILTAIQSQSLGVKELVKATRRRSQATVQLIQALRAQGLVIAERRVSGRGRPREVLRVTSLGFEYLEAFARLSGVPLRATEGELRRAVEEARYAGRLAAGGVDTFRAFLELNAFVRAIGDAR